MHQDLAAFYENPEVPNSFGGVEALHRSVKGKSSKKDVKHWLSQKDAYTLHKPVRHKFQRNRVFVSDIDCQFQADLVDIQYLAEFNKGYKYLLTCIDLFSKFAWAVPLKDKFGKSVKSGLEIIFKERKPKVLQTDAGVYSRDTLPPLQENMFAIVNSDDSSQPGTHCYQVGHYKDPVVYRGIDVPKIFIEKLEKDAKQIDIYKNSKPLLPLTESEKQLYDNANNCYVCDQTFYESNIKFRDHNHVTQKFNGPCCNSCNLAMKAPKFLPVFFHNLSGYDAHIFINELGYDEKQINLIPNTEEKYISFSKNISNDFQLRF
ncbi:uncharacterized transposon-derived protein F54H12.3 [Trichonephila clavipes]|nr:uncharacterized transposon-derived protein F54H12.3 [Trichonephila clavipes]